MLRLGRLLILIATVSCTSSLTACADNGPATVPGGYLLETIGGQSLPRQIDASTVVQADDFIVGTDATFEKTGNVTINGSPGTSHATGTWSQIGNTITFIITSGGQGTITATWSPGSLTVDGAGGAWIYRKQ